MATQKNQLLFMALYAIGLMITCLAGMWIAIKYDYGICMMVTVLSGLYFGSILLIKNRS